MNLGTAPQTPSLLLLNQACDILEPMSGEYVSADRLASRVESADERNGIRSRHHWGRSPPPPTKSARRCPWFPLSWAGTMQLENWLALTLTLSPTGTIQLKSGSATVPVAPVGVPPTGSARLAIHQTVRRLVEQWSSAGRRKQRARRPRSPEQLHRSGPGEGTPFDHAATNH
jgi:hypothetical protein